jgi:ABC-type glycerol-3-phosphate transport system substrate-binding protein
MRFQTVQDILQHTAELHGRLADILSSASSAHHQQRLSQLLRYLADHEQQLRHSLENYATEEADHLLNTWFDHAPNPALPQIPESLEALLSAEDVDTAMSPILDFQDQMIRVYQQLHDQANNQSVKDFFAGLADIEQAEKRQMAGDAKHFEDV